MHSAFPTARQAPARTAERPRPNPARPFLLAPPKRRPIDSMFAAAIVRCMKEGRFPASHEVHAVAARIWSDIQPGSAKIPWDDVVPGCGAHRRMVAAARAALGDPRSDGKPP